MREVGRTGVADPRGGVPEPGVAERARRPQEEQVVAAAVVGGALFGFIPGLPTVKLDPNVVLVVFLPVLVYSAAFFANLGDIRANLRGITMVSVGLVLVTMTAVAASPTRSSD
jgi:NhaP-type Na+/H+ or K+/H+ antiporter